MNKKARQKRSIKTRIKIKLANKNRLMIHKTPMHIYAQLTSPDGGTIIAQASTLSKEIKKEISHGGNITAAKIIGKHIAARAQSAGVTAVAFDRSGFPYHGRIKALADEARKTGLQF